MMSRGKLPQGKSKLSMTCSTEGGVTDMAPTAPIAKAAVVSSCNQERSGRALLFAFLDK